MRESRHFHRQAISHNLVKILHNPAIKTASNSTRNWYGPEGLVDEEVRKRKERPSVINLPPVLIEGPSRGVDKCRYECKDDGGCSVRFITR